MNKILKLGNNFQHSNAVKSNMFFFKENIIFYVNPYTIKLETFFCEASGVFENKINEQSNRILNI